MMKSAAWAVLALIGAAGVMAGCEGGLGPEDEVAAVLDLGVDSLHVALGDTVRLHGTVRNAAGRALPDVEIQWSSVIDDTTLLEVAISSGPTTRLRGIVPGRARLVATAGELTQTLPVRVVAHSRTFTSVSGGPATTCGVSDTGEVFCWGVVYMGEWPSGGTYSGNLWAPAPVPGAPAMVQVDAGFQSACGLDALGQAYCWGWSVPGLFGDGSPQGSRTEPTPVSGGHSFRSLSFYSHTICGLTHAGAAFCWGSDVFGRVGDGPGAESCFDSADEPCATEPRAVAAHLTFDQLVTGGTHACGLVDGAAYCWGSNAHGQLGADAEETCPSLLGPVPCASAPIPVDTDLRFHTLALGATHSCGLTGDGTAYCWGDGRWGQRGDDSVGSAQRPVLVHGGPFAVIGAGDAFTCALTETGEPWCWGISDVDQTGAAAASAVTCVVEHQAWPCVPVPTPAAAVSLSSLVVGGAVVCGMVDDQPHCWGWNRLGQLGSGRLDMASSRIPQPVAGSVGK